MNNKRKNILIIAVAVSVAVTSILITTGFALRHNNDDIDSSFVLKAYENTVALFVGDEIVEIYSNVILDALPEEDIRQLENGLVFQTHAEARQAVEDYDG